MPPNSEGRSFVKKLVSESRGRKMCKTAMPLNSSGNCVSYAPERRGQKISETAILPNNVSRINNEDSKECKLLCGKISRTTALAKAYCYICLTYLILQLYYYLINA